MHQNSCFISFVLFLNGNISAQSLLHGSMWLFCCVLQPLFTCVRRVDLLYVQNGLGKNKYVESMYFAHSTYFSSIFKMPVLSYIWLGIAWSNLAHQAALIKNGGPLQDLSCPGVQVIDFV